jgi:hypothetical protein
VRGETSEQEGGEIQAHRRRDHSCTEVDFWEVITVPYAAGEQATVWGRPFFR